MIPQISHSHKALSLPTATPGSGILQAEILHASIKNVVLG
jgi:hypothetical protein